MEKPMLFYEGLLLLGVFLSAISQVMLKKRRCGNTRTRSASI